MGWLSPDYFDAPDGQMTDKTAKHQIPEQDFKTQTRRLDDLLWQYMKATEWNLATLEELEELKGTAKHRIARQKKICYDMVIVCQSFVKKDHNFPTDGKVGRLMEELEKYWKPRNGG